MSDYAVSVLFGDFVERHIDKTNKLEANAAEARECLLTEIQTAIDTAYLSGGLSCEFDTASALDEIQEALNDYSYADERLAFEAGTRMLK